MFLDSLFKFMFLERRLLRFFVRIGMNKSWRAPLVLNLKLVDRASIWIAVSCGVLVGLSPNVTNLVSRVTARIFAFVVEFSI